MKLPLGSACGVVLFAHGSLLCDAARTLEVHRDRIRNTALFVATECGFLNYSEPSVERAIGLCEAAGAQVVVVVPWFLVPGKFVLEDLPPRLEAARVLYPHLDIRVTAPLGPDPVLDQLVAVAAQGSVDIEQADCLPATEGRQCGNQPSCPNYGSGWCLQYLNQTDTENPISPMAMADHLEPFSPGDGLLVIAHGSPRVRTVALVESSARTGAQALGDVPVVTAFLDCNEPDIPAGVEAIAAQMQARGQCGSVVVVPYFLHAGKHVARDLPSLLREGMDRVPGIRLRLAPHLGWLEDLTQLALARIYGSLSESKSGAEMEKSS